MTRERAEQLADGWLDDPTDGGESTKTRTLIKLLLRVADEEREVAIFCCNEEIEYWVEAGGWDSQEAVRNVRSAIRARAGQEDK